MTLTAEMCQFRTSAIAWIAISLICAARVGGIEFDVGVSLWRPYDWQSRDGDQQPRP